MKTEEFIERAEVLGYEVEKTTCLGVSCLDIKIAEECVACVSLRGRYDFDISSEFYNEAEKNQDALFDLLVEFAKTPLYEREEKKEYYIRLSGVGIPGWNRYLNQSYGEVFFADNRENIEVKSKFTDDEISELPTWVIDMLNDGYLVKEEV